MSRTVGGHIPGITIACACKTAWTDPEIGNLVIWDTTGNTFVDECAADENPIGQVMAINPAKTIVTVELFTGGMVAVLPYSAAPSRGDKVEAEGSVNTAKEGKIRTDNSNGVGKVVAVDRVTGYADVYFG